MNTFRVFFAKLHRRKRAAISKEGSIAGAVQTSVPARQLLAWTERRMGDAENRTVYGAGNRLHAGGRLAMTAGAGAPLFAGRLIPQRTTARNPQHARIGKFITLQSAHFGTGKFNA